MKLKDILHKIYGQFMKVFNIFPLNNIILFESNPDFNDEGYWMCKKFLDKEMNQKYKIYWYLKSHESRIPDDWDISCIYLKPKNIVQWIQKYYVLCTAKCILDSCMFIPKMRKEQFRLFLHHGMPIKKINKYMESIGEYDYISIGSPYFVNYYLSINVPQEKQVILGLARNDQLKEYSNYVDRLYPINSDCKKIIWMPTYRQHESSENACNIPVNKSNTTGLPIIHTFEDVAIINHELKEKNLLLIIKLHQSQNLRYLNIENLSNIKILTTKMLQDNSIQMYSLLADMDALITDYSSIYIDFLLTHRPIGLTIDDIDIYEKIVGFAVDNYMTDIQGFHIKDLNGFLDFLDQISMNDNFMNDAIEEAYRRFHTITDFSSSEQLFHFIVNKAGLRK